MIDTAYAMTVPSPIGDILLMSDGDALTGLYLERTPPPGAIRD
ncbi:MAG: hypothetical protein QOH90_1438, partial [Actinomycetota bacterium]|nr:hypothetical protein [Actinomycetota bacterium]